MARFILQPCKLRATITGETRLVPTKDEPLSFEWTDLCLRLAPTKSKKAKMQLRTMQVGAFVGTTTSKNPDYRHVQGAPEFIRTNFIFCNQDRTGKIAWLLKQDPTFPERLSEVFRVESVEWDASLEELGKSSRAA